MKTASKVFIILSMVIVALAAILTLSIFGSFGYAVCSETLEKDPSSGLSAQQLFTFAMVGISVIYAFAIASVEIVGAIALKKLNTATNKDQLVGIGVCTLIFCSLIGGILMLCLTDADLKQA